MEGLKWHCNNHACHITAHQGPSSCWEEYFCQKSISAQVGCSQSTVSHILSSPPDKLKNKGGCPKQISATSDRALRQITNANHFKTTTEVPMWNEVTATQVPRSTTYRCMRRFLEPHSAHRTLAHLQSEEKRLQFTRKYSKWTADNWKFYSRKVNLPLAKVTNELEYGRKTWKIRHVWSWVKSIQHRLWFGVVSAWGAGSLCFLTPNTSQQRATGYLPRLICGESLWRKSFVFQHDSAPAHRAKKHTFLTTI